MPLLVAEAALYWWGERRLADGAPEKLRIRRLMVGVAALTVLVLLVRFSQAAMNDR